MRRVTFIKGFLSLFFAISDFYSAAPVCCPQFAVCMRRIQVERIGTKTENYRFPKHLSVYGDSAIFQSVSAALRRIFVVAVGHFVCIGEETAGTANCIASSVLLIDKK